MINKFDTVCCFGDSITAGGLFVAEVFDNLAKYGIKVYNCGVAGDTAYDSLRRIETDCLCYNPTVVTVMFGVNDIGHWLSPDTTDTETFDFLINRHKENLKKVVKIFLDKRIRVILMSPPPYCEGDAFKTEDFKCNNRVKCCADYAKELAEKCNCDFIDIHNAFVSLDNMPHYFREDRVHPNEKGQRVIASAVLQKLGFDYISDYDSDFQFSDLNAERMKSETLYKEIMYAKHDTIDKYCNRMGITMTDAEKDEHIKKEINSPYPYVAYCAEKYIKNIKNIEEIKNQIRFLTEKMIKTGDFMQKYAWKATVKEGCLEEYKKRHREIWSEMVDVLKEAGIANYTIWNVGNELFGYYECEKGLKFAADYQASSPVVDRWNEYMKDVMVMDLDPVTGAQPLLTKVFELD